MPRLSPIQNGKLHIPLAGEPIKGMNIPLENLEHMTYIHH
jgi:hypothetical protein